MLFIFKYKLHNYTYIFVPYVPVGKFNDALKSINSITDLDNNIVNKIENFTDIDNFLSHTNILFAHQEFKGVDMNGKKSDSSDIWPLNRPLLISGHIHEFSNLQNNLIYTGTPLQHTFGENPDKSISEINISNSIINHERIRLQLRKKITININYNELYNFKITDYPDSYIKLVINGNGSELKSLIKNTFIENLTLSGIKIKYNNIETPQISDLKNISETLKTVSYLNILESKIAHKPNLYDLYKKILN